MVGTALVLALIVGQTGQLVSGFCPTGAGCPKVVPIKVGTDGTVATSGGSGGNTIVSWTVPGPVLQSGPWDVNALQKGPWSVNALQSGVWNVNSITNPVAVTGPLTDAQLRATPVPVSGTVAATQSGTWNINSITTVPSHPVTQAGTWSVNALQSGVWNVNSITNPVSVTGPLTDAQLALRVNTLGQKTMANSTPVSIASDQSAISTFNGTIDSGNSSTTPLGAAGVFTGTAFDTFNFGAFNVQVFSNVSSAANGVSLQFSNDGTNWDESTAFTFTAGGTAFNIQGSMRSRFFRVVYTNGGTLQATFRLQTLYKTATPSGDVLENLDTIQSTTHSQIVRSIVVGKPTANTFADVAALTGNPAGTESGIVTRNIPSGTQAVSGTVTANAGTGTMAVSAASLPLPTGAATETTLSAMSAKLTGTLGPAAATVAFSTGPSTIATAIDAGTCTNVSVTATVLASNTARKVAIIYNNGNQKVHIKLGATATTANPPLAAGQSLTLEGPTIYTGVVDAIASSGTQSVCAYSW